MFTLRLRSMATLPESLDVPEIPDEQSTVSESAVPAEVVTNTPPEPSDVSKPVKQPFLTRREWLALSGISLVTYFTARKVGAVLKNRKQKSEKKPEATWIKSRWGKLIEAKEFTLSEPLFRAGMFMQYGEAPSSAPGWRGKMNDILPLRNPSGDLPDPVKDLLFNIQIVIRVEPEDEEVQKQTLYPDKHIGEYVIFDPLTEEEIFRSENTPEVIEFLLSDLRKFQIPLYDPEKRIPVEAKRPEDVKSLQQSSSPNKSALPSEPRLPPEMDIFGG